MDVKPQQHSLEGSELWRRGKAKQRSGNPKRKCTTAEREEEKLIRREKNRIAARDSRARKLRCLTNLQQDMEALKKANAVMSLQLDQIQAKACAAWSSSKTLKEEIQQFVDLWSPAERQVLDDVLERIIALADKRGSTQCTIAQLPGQTLTSSGASGQKAGGIATGTQALEKGDPWQPEGDASGGLGPSLSQAAAVSQEEGEPSREEEPFGMGSPILSSFHHGSNCYPLDGPLGWLFY